MEAADTRDHGCNLLVAQWRPAADAVPAEEQLHHHRRVHFVPEQMTRQRGDRVVTFTGRDAIGDHPTPVRE
jgi:hypothetical protein